MRSAHNKRPAAAVTANGSPRSNRPGGVMGSSNNNARSAAPPASKDTANIRQLPYGRWLCADGREVLFDRDYKPICQRYPETTPTLANSREWIPYVEQSWFYNDETPDAEKLEIATAKLQEWGMLEAVKRKQ